MTTTDFNLSYIFPKIYSNIQVVQKGQANINKDVHVILMTTIRKKGTDGLYYLQTIMNRRIYDYEADLYTAYKQFIIEIFLNLNNSIVVGDQKDTFGNPLFPLDEDQTPENERILKLITG